MKRETKDSVSKVSTSQSGSILSVGIVGSRNLCHTLSDKVGGVTEDLLDRGYHIASGGAMGTDQFCVERLLRIGLSDQATIYAPWKDFSGFPVKVRVMMRQYQSYGGSIVWGISSGQEPRHVLRVAYLQRNVRIVHACYGIVAFITSSSRGTLFTISQAIKNHLTVVLFPVSCELPVFDAVKWRPIRCGGVWNGGFKACYLR